MAESPSLVAARDQALAAASDVVAPLGGKIVDTQDALLTVVIGRDAVAHCTGTTRDWRWVAASLRAIADNAERRADAEEAGRG